MGSAYSGIFIYIFSYFCIIINIYVLSKFLIVLLFVSYVSLTNKC